MMKKNSKYPTWLVVAFVASFFMLLSTMLWVSAVWVDEYVQEKTEEVEEWFGLTTYLF